MGQFFDEGVYVWTEFTTRRHSERKEGVGSGERAPILVYLPFSGVGEVFPSLPCRTLEVAADARVDYG